MRHSLYPVLNKTELVVLAVFLLSVHFSETYEIPAADISLGSSSATVTIDSLVRRVTVSADAICRLQLCNLAGIK